MNYELVRKARQGAECCRDMFHVQCSKCPYILSHTCVDELWRDIESVTQKAAGDDTLTPQLRDLAGRLHLASAVHRDEESHCDQCPYELYDDCTGGREADELEVLRQLDGKEGNV